MELNHKGIELSFDVGGIGARHFLFIHGLGTNRNFFSSQFQHFSQMGKILNVDLRGHGRSGKPEKEYTVEGYAEDIAWLCSEQDIVKPIVVAHSIGGNIALELNRRYPDLFSAIFLLDTFLFLPPAASEYIAGRAQAMKLDYHKCLEEMVEMRCGPLHRAVVRKSFFATPQYVFTSSLENMLDWDKKRAEECVRECQIPIIYIEGPKLVIDLTKFDACYSSQLIRGKVICSGHFINIEAAEQLNAMIESFIKNANAQK